MDGDVRFADTTNHVKGATATRPHEVRACGCAAVGNEPAQGGDLSMTTVEVDSRAHAEVERLVERLAEPRTAAALHTLLDNLELLEEWLARGGW